MSCRCRYQADFRTFSLEREMLMERNYMIIMELPTQPASALKFAGSDPYNRSGSFLRRVR